MSVYVKHILRMGKIGPELSNEEDDVFEESDHCHGVAGSLDYDDHVPPLPTRRKTTAGLGPTLIRGTTLDRDKRHRASLPAQISSEYSIQNGRSPAKRKRDSFLKRRHNSASAIQLSTVCSSVPSSLSSMSECNEDGNGHTDDVNISNTNDPQSQAFIRLHSSTDDSSSKCSRKGRPVHSNSCPHIETTSYQMFDIVGDESGIRFPWQRDASTQCNIQIERGKYVKSRSVDASSSSSSSLTPPNTLSLSYLDCGNRGGQGIVRPHSIGCLEGTVHEGEIERLRQEQARKARKSDSFLQVSPRSLRKRASFAVSDEHGSVSDLGSISENPDIEGRDFSLEESHMADLSSELRRIALKSAEQYRDINILSSPRVSPTIFDGSNQRHSGSDSDDCSGPDSQSRKYLTIPRKNSRRRSSLSLTSVSDESDVEPSPPVARRGRRAAIVDTKNFGDVSPTTLSPEVSPSNSCDEGDNASNIAERLRRRRSSVDLTMNVYPGDLLVHDHHKKLMKRNTIADLYSQKNGSSSSISDEHKKGRQSFSLRKLMKTRSKESIPRLEDVLSQMKPSEFRDNHLSAYKNLHWSDLIASSDKQTDAVKLPEVERKRREAVWELFKSECVFLIDHLMVLKHCFMEPLKKVQVEGHVMFAEPQDIFGNLDELCYVSYTFCKDFISALLKDMSSTDFGSTSVLIRAFERFTTHSRDGGVYHTYCLNYVNALTYLEQLRRHEDFTEFEKWCTQDPRCNRLQLTDLLVAPMQHCTKFPLLLNNIKKYTDNSAERNLLAELIEKVGVSLQKMEDKMKWAKNYERLQEIQGQLVWPSVADIDPRAFVPDFLKTALTKQPCERMICSPKRQLIHEGYLTLVESAKTSDVYVFLFDDILLITRTKKPQRKKHSIDSIHIRLQQSGQSDKIVHTVYRQPVALDRLSVHDITPSDATANGLKHAFVLVQISRYQQIIGVFTLQAVTDSHKAIWVDKLSQAREKFNSVPDILANQLSPGEEGGAQDGLISSDIVRATKQNRRAPSLRNPHGKSLSMDAVYL
ncbi:uncharacterized protein LOC110461715 [Mizuhopecten yessoensis]|uniref:Pleckstrin homology domain-containing family G member 7 n=1 Tax=Mizuhopecten yessoensis TaxID=6573 RepID=A0A210PZQ9_MIZYE|nr:uncharacterized protein LOC110461715 [Mizuhopecten yessoensis]OWF41968.1 Pleckstrin homology domain-containing family G member 7 [Mizuhopecten yessoensis]